MKGGDITKKKKCHLQNQSEIVNKEIAENEGELGRTWVKRAVGARWALR